MRRLLNGKVEAVVVVAKRLLFGPAWRGQVREVRAILKVAPRICVSRNRERRITLPYGEAAGAEACNRGGINHLAAPAGAAASDLREGRGQGGSGRY